MIPYRFDPVATAATETEPIYFTLKSLANNSVVSLTQVGTVNISQLYYKTKSTDWQLCSYNNPITLNKGEYIQFYNHSEQLSKSNNDYVNFALTGQIEAQGNIQSLLNFRENAPAYCFRKLFQNCKALVKAPKVFPATMAFSFAYAGMFSKAGITNMPKIEATFLQSQACFYMFEECPIEYGLDLPATTIGYDSYGYMFKNCTSLKSSGEILVTKFSNTTACISMFEGRSNLKTGPSILRVTDPQRYSYQSMFSGCSKLEKAPILPMTTLYTECYKNMFNGCSSLKEYQVAFTSWPTNNATNNWVSGAKNTSDVIFKCPAALDTTTKDNSHVLSNWTIVHI